MKRSYNTILKYGRQLVKSIIDEDYFGISAEVSYMLTMGIFPFMLFLTAVFGLIGRRFFINKIIGFLSIVTPNEVVNLIKIFLKEVIYSKNGGFVATIGFLATLILASNAINSIIKALNKANGVKETRNFFYVKILAVVMVVVNTILMFLSVNLIIMWKTIVEFLSNHIYIPYVYGGLVSFARWAIAFVLLFLAAVINYYILPSIDFSSKRRSVIPGSIFFCVMWLLGSWLFSLYVDSFGTYNRVYGSIAGIAIMMVWLQYTAMIMLIGGEINNINFES